MSQNKILVTGATGHLGTDVINNLLEKTDSGNIIALARDLSKAAPLRDKGVEIREGNYDDYGSLVSAFTGIDKVYFVSASDIDKRIRQHKNVVAAAKEAGVKHIIYTSFQRENDTESSPIAAIAEAHLATEEQLKDSGMQYTILKHNLYMDFLPMFLGEQVLETGTIFLPAGDGKAAVAMRSDMGAVGAAILTSEGHENKVYNISAPVAYSFQEIAEELSNISGKKISYISPEKEVFVNTLKEAGVPEEGIGISVGFAEAIKQGELAETAPTIEALTGKKPITLRQFLQQVYAS